uniref:Transposase n=1 Tax=Steinernema glaseri TaxID=37863 RepID=A0A1I8A8R2_9BILA
MWDVAEASRERAHHGSERLAYNTLHTASSARLFIVLQQKVDRVRTPTKEALARYDRRPRIVAFPRKALECQSNRQSI